jgi:hypothetical protein
VCLGGVVSRTVCLAVLFGFFLGSGFLDGFGCDYYSCYCRKYYSHDLALGDELWGMVVVLRGRAFMHVAFDDEIVAPKSLRVLVQSEH